MSIFNRKRSKKKERTIDGRTIHMLIKGERIVWVKWMWDHNAWPSLVQYKQAIETERQKRSFIAYIVTNDEMKTAYFMCYVISIRSGFWSFSFNLGDFFSYPIIIVIIAIKMISNAQLGNTNASDWPNAVCITSKFTINFSSTLHFPNEKKKKKN